MSRHLARLLTGSAVTFSMLVAGCGQSPSQGPAIAAPPPAVDVTVLAAHRQAIPVAIDAVAQAFGSREVEVRARVNGILEKRVYDEGTVVAAGAELYRIDRIPYEITLAQARANLLLVQARQVQARREAARLKSLADERAISRKEFDDASSALDQSEAVLAQVAAQVREAELNLSYTSVTAPISGVSGRSLRSEGTLVTASNDSALLTTIVQVNPIWVLFSVSQAEYEQIHAVGTRARVTLLRADGSSHATVGRVNFTASTVDPKLSTVQLRAEFANPSLQWLPGQFVRVRVLAGEQTVVLVPQQAVVQGELEKSVWVMSAEGKATPRVVKAGNWSGSQWAILAGLNDGDLVIVDNLIKLRPGTAVQTAKH